MSDWYYMVLPWSCSIAFLFSLSGAAEWHPGSYSQWLPIAPCSQHLHKGDKPFHPSELIWWLPKIGLPPVIIHFHGIFQNLPFLDSPMTMESSIYVMKPAQRTVNFTRTVASFGGSSKYWEVGQKKSSLLWEASVYGSSRFVIPKNPPNHSTIVTGLHDFRDVRAPSTTNLAFSSARSGRSWTPQGTAVSWCKFGNGHWKKTHIEKPGISIWDIHTSILICIHPLSYIHIHIYIYLTYVCIYI